MEVRSMPQHDFHIRKHYQIWNVLYKILQKSFFPMAAMCQALPSFHSDYYKKSLFICVSSDFYENYIVIYDYCVSTHNSLCSLANCKFNSILIGISFSQIFQRLDNVYTYIKKLTVFTLCSNTDYIQVLLR